MWKSTAQSLTQDAATVGAAWLAGHGFLAQDQTQAFIGSVVFLGMLAFNAIVQHKQTGGA